MVYCVYYLKTILLLIKGKDFEMHHQLYLSLVVISKNWVEEGDVDAF